MKHAVILLPDITTRGGVEQASVNLASILTGTLAYRVTVLTCFNSKAEPAYTFAEGIAVRSLGLPVYPSGMGRVTWYLNLVKPLRRWLTAHACDVLIVQGGYLSSAAALLRRPRPVIIGYEHIDPLAMNPMHRLIARLTYRRLDVLVVLTDRYAARYRWLPNVFVIPNIAPEAPIKTSHHSHTIVACGRLARQKGFDLLIAAAALFLPRTPGWRVIIYGEGPERTELEREIARHGLAGNVVLAGETHDVQARLAEGAIFVMPSRFEGFSITLIEAMAAGLPCISFDCPGCADVIRHNVNGLLVPSGDVRRLADEICALIGDLPKRRELGSQAVLAADLYSYAQIAARWAALFENLAMFGAPA